MGRGGIRKGNRGGGAAAGETVVPGSLQPSTDQQVPKTEPTVELQSATEDPQNVNVKVRVAPRPDDDTAEPTTTTGAAAGVSVVSNEEKSAAANDADDVDLVKKDSRPADQGAWATCAAPPAMSPATSSTNKDDTAPPAASPTASPADTRGDAGAAPPPATKKQRTPKLGDAAPTASQSRPYREVVEQLRATWRTKRTLPLEWRLAQLGLLRQGVADFNDRINAALHEDLGKSEFETYAHEISQVVQEIDYFERNLATLVAQERVMAPLVQMPSMGYILPQALGVVYLASPWNYPLNLCLVPLVGAIAAGNCVLIKPSHRSKATRKVIKDIVDTVLDTECFQVVFADSHDEQDAILREKFDYMFFTGSPRVGRVIMEAAAKNLTPMTLELGGKSPVIVDQSAQSALAVAVRRIMWGKMQNCGQTCIAPDYALVHESLVPDFIKLAIECLRSFYGDDFAACKDYGRLIDEKHFDKLESLLSDASQFAVAFGGERDRASRFFGPTLLTDVKLDAELMQAEIFGPILPIIPFSTIDDAIDFVNERARPLALYCFCQDDATTTRVLAETTSGGACVNETFVHVGVPGLPFGGVGESGMGHYHGKFSFDTFTHQKSILRKATFVDPPIRYPPYTSTKTTLMHLLA